MALIDDKLDELPPAQIAREAVHEVVPVLRAEVAALPESLRRIAEYHFGWSGVDGADPTGATSRMRMAALTVLCARAVNADHDHGGRDVAAAWTLMGHQTRLHDDLIDREPVRYGRPAAWCQFGKEATLQAGNALLAQAFALLARQPGPRVPATVECLSQAVVEIGAGQILDVAVDCEAANDAERYLHVVCTKTGPLLSSACRLGALSADASDAQICAFTRFGRHLGTALQLHNDLEDLWSNPVHGQSPLRSDLRNRKKTLPVIAAFADARGERLRYYYRSAHAPSQAELQDLACLIEECGGRARTEEVMRDAVARALDCLDDAAVAPRWRQRFSEFAIFLTTY